MVQKVSHLFPQDFLHKLINFPKETLTNLFKLCQKAMEQFISNELSALDPLVCENACHVRAFILWHMTHKYEKKTYFDLHVVMHTLNAIIQRIDLLPPINKQTKQTIENYLQTYDLYLQLDNELLFDIKFIFLSYLLTITKRTLPSSSFILHEKTSLEALNMLGLVHNKIKCLVSSAQKELSSMSCQFIQRQSELLNNTALSKLLVTRYDTHKRSYLPQYSTAKVILLNALQNNIPLIIRVSRFVQNRYHDELILGFMSSSNKNDFYFTRHINDESKTAIICEGIINYPERAESSKVYVDRLNQYSLIQILLANFAVHPQFSGNLRHTPCVYKEAFKNAPELNIDITQEWEEFRQHACLAKKEGCSLENPNLLLLNHIFCDAIVYYPLSDLSITGQQTTLLDDINL